MVLYLPQAYRYKYMWRISKLTDYAFIILSCLASAKDSVLSAASIARETHLALPTVSKLLKILADAELVISFRGQGGGYQLAENTLNVTVADVIAAVEGAPAITECCTLAKACTLESLCTIKENWRAVNKMIFSVLAGLTLHDMIRPLVKNPITLKGIPVIVKGLVVDE